MKVINVSILSALVLSTPIALAHPDHDAPTGIRGARVAAPAAVEKAYGRPGGASQASRSINLDISEKFRVTPADIAVKQGETILFVIKNSSKAAQRVALGTAADLKETAAMLKQFPKMEMNQPNLLEVKPGESAELLWQFTQAGTFNIACTAPACLAAAAVGKVVVDAK